MLPEGYKWEHFPAVVTREKKEENKKQNNKKLVFWTSFFRYYPDIYLDMIQPKKSAFKLKTFQRVVLRSIERFQYVFATQTRYTAKSFNGALARLVHITLYPGCKCRIVAGGTKEQGARISSEKIKEIRAIYPYFELEQNSFSDSKGIFNYTITNNSSYEVLGISAQTRGGRGNAGIVEEAFDVDIDTYNNVIAPLFNGRRITASGGISPAEPSEQIAYITTAGMFMNQMNTKQLQMLELMVGQKTYSGKDTNLVFGSNWRLPVYFELIPESKVSSIKNDITVSDITFRREYGSEWVKLSESSLFNYSDIEQCRTVKIAQLSAENTDNKYIYWVSYDAARSGGSVNDNAIALVFRGSLLNNNVLLKENVAIYVWHDEEKYNSGETNAMHFFNQALDLKKIVERYNAVGLVVDAAGLGSGIIDFLVMDNKDETTGLVYKKYAVISKNGEKIPYNKIDVTGNPMLHLIDANESLNDEMHSTLLGHFQSKLIRLLVKPYQTEKYIYESNKDEKIIANQDLYLSHNRETDMLIEEINMLEVQINNKNRIKVSAVGKKRKDRFSALEYGVWWGKKYLETEYENKLKSKNSIEGLSKMYKEAKIKKRYKKIF